MKKSLKPRALTLEKFIIAHLSDLQGDRILGGESTGCNTTTDPVKLSIQNACTTNQTIGNNSKYCNV